MLLNRLVVAMATLAALGFGLAEHPAEAQQKLEKITITSGGEGMHYFPIYVARGAGFFKEEGLDAEWVNVNSGSRQAASIMGGSAEITPLGLYHVVESHAQGGNLVAIASLFDVYAMTLVLSNDAYQKSGIQDGMTIDEKVNRLKGFQIAVSAPGSSTDMLIRSLFRARGMDVDKVLKLQPLGNDASIMAAFDKKVTDGFIWTAPLPEIVTVKGLGKVVVNPFTGEVPELNDVPFVALVTSRETLGAKPAKIRAAMRAVTKALIFSHEHPAETRKIMRQYFPELEDSVYEVMVEKYRLATSKSPMITPDQIARTVAWMNLGQPTPYSANYLDIVDPAMAQETLAALAHK